MKRLKEKIIKFHYILEFFILIFLSIFFEISFRTKFDFTWPMKYLILSQLGNVLIISLLMMLRSKTKRFTGYMVYLFFALGLFITDSCLYFYKQDVFSIGMLAEIPNGITMGIKYNILAAFSYYYWLFVLLLIGLFIFSLYYLCYESPLREPFTGKIRVSVIIFIFTFLSLASSLTATIIKGSETAKIDEKIYESPQDKRTFIMTFGLNTFRTKDLMFSTYQWLMKPLEIENSNKLLEENIKTLTPIKSNKHGLFENKNLILILCETCEDYAIDEVLTPNLYNLVYGDNSFSFSNMYTSAKLDYTYDAEFKALTSMMYFNNDSYMRTYDKNSFTNALPSVLKDKGYSANSFHSFYGNYFNRLNMHKSLGFERYYHFEDMEFSPYSFWPLDSEMFDQMKDIYAPIDQENPFFSFILTLTAHGSHNEYRKELSQYYETIEKDGRFNDRELSFKTILAAQMDLDAGIKIMLDHLEENNILDDTVIALFADHKNYSSLDITKKYTKLTKPEYIFEYDRIPYAIYNSKLEGENLKLITSQYDITPTLLDLFGVEYYQELYYGQSVFLNETNQYQKKNNILGFNRWISDDIVLFEKELLYISDNITNIDEFIYKQQEIVAKEIMKYHALFMVDYFKNNKSYVEFNK